MILHFFWTFNKKRRHEVFSTIPYQHLVYFQLMTLFIQYPGPHHHQTTAASTVEIKNVSILVVCNKSYVSPFN